MASNDISQEDVEFLTLGKILFTIYSYCFYRTGILKKNYDCDGRKENQEKKSTEVIQS